MKSILEHTIASGTSYVSDRFWNKTKNINFAEGVPNAAFIVQSGVEDIISKQVLIFRKMFDEEYH